MIQIKYYSFFLFIGFAMTIGLLLPSLSSAQFADASHIPANEMLTPSNPIPMPWTYEEENQVWLGFEGGINYNMNNASSFPYPDLDPVVISEKNGNGIAPRLGISFELPISSANQNIITLGMLYDSKSAAFNPGSAKDVDLARIFYTHVLGNITTDLNATLSYLTLDIGYKYNFQAAPVPAGPGLELSFYTGVYTSGSFNETVTASARDTTHNNELVSLTRTSTVDIKGIHLFRFGLRGQFSYDIPFTENFFISVMAGYDFPISKVDDTERSWRVSSIFAGIAARFKIQK